jgi:hypothetical protein
LKDFLDRVARRRIDDVSGPVSKGSLTLSKNWIDPDDSSRTGDSGTLDHELSYPTTPQDDDD